MSEALSSLDRAVGVSVVRRRRGAHSVTLTPFGEALLPHAMRVLREIDDAHVSLANVTREAQARVRIAANESVSTYLLAPVLGRLRRRWPRTQFSVVVGACAEIRAAVAADSCDVGLLLEARPRPGDVPPGLSPTSGALASSTLVDDVPLTIFGAPDHPLAQRVDVPSASLSAFSLLIADSAGDFHQLVQRYFLDGDLPGPRLESVGSIEAVKRGVTADHASLGLLPRYAVEEELAAGRVRAVAVVQAPPRMRLVALRSRGPDTHPVVRDLLLSLGAAET